MSAAAAYTCPACGSTGTDHEIRVPDHEYGVSFVATYVRCSSCGSEFQAPMPDDATLGSFYPEDYHSMSADGLLVRIRNAMRWKRLAALLPADGVLLDYGCGEGQFLRYAAEQAPARSFFGYEIEAMTKSTFYFVIAVLVFIDIVQGRYQKKLLNASS